MPAKDDIRKAIAQFPNSFNLKNWALMEDVA